MFDLTDLKQLLDLLTELERDLGPAHKGRFWCPWCQKGGASAGHHAPVLSVYGKRYKCFGCLKSGDVITWLREYREMSWKDLRELAEITDLPIAKSHSAPVQLTTTEPPGVVWQNRALAFVENCEARLWQPEGARALAYLQDSRGLDDETIRFYHLGYNPVDLYESCQTWGLTKDPDNKRMWLPRSIVIPCFIGGILWYVNMRRPAVDPKYYKIKGSKAALFGADNLRGADIALVTEGELDCMLASRLVGDVCGVVTLGGKTTHLNLAAWGVYLLPARAVLVAYDSDGKSDLDAARLASLSSRMHIARVPVLRPDDKDITDYYKAGGDLWRWINYTLEQLDLLRILGLAKPDDRSLGSYNK